MYQTTWSPITGRKLIKSIKITVVQKKVHKVHLWQSSLAWSSVTFPTQNNIRRGLTKINRWMDWTITVYLTSLNVIAFWHSHVAFTLRAHIQCLLLSLSLSCPLSGLIMRPDSLLRLWRYINLLLSYLLTYIYVYMSIVMEGRCGHTMSITVIFNNALITLFNNFMRLITRQKNSQWTVYLLCVPP